MAKNEKRCSGREAAKARVAFIPFYISLPLCITVTECRVWSECIEKQVLALIIRVNVVKCELALKFR